MPRPTLLRWLNRWFWGGLLVTGLWVAGLFVANVVDYYPFYSALRRVGQLSPDALRAIATACAEHERIGYHVVTGEKIPTAFRSLDPIEISFDPGSTDVRLFERGDIYVFLRITTSARNQEIECVSTGSQSQRTRRLWERNPEVTQELNPTGRIVTIAESDMHNSREWIVLPAEMLVIDRRGAGGSEDKIVARFRLTSEQQTAIQAACYSLTPTVRGHYYDGGAVDGIALRVCFTEDGRRGDDIALSNTWRDDIHPLLQAISESIPAAYAIEFEAKIGRMRSAMEAPARALTWAEFDRRNRPRVAWWCLWPRWFAYTS